MASRKKVVFIAMDAGDKFLIRKWAADGSLKTFRTLLDNGFVGETMSLPGLYEGATWPSFYTGVTPAHHGFHRLIQLNPGTYDFYRCYTGDFIKKEPFWSHLGNSGRKVAVLDIPLSGVTKNINGIQMVEWGSHDPNYGFCTWPRGLKREVLSKFGPHPAQDSCDAFQRTPREYSIFRDKLIKGVETKTRLTKHFLTSDRWDFFAQVFTEGHCAGHQCWHLHDINHPSYSPEVVAMTGNPVRDVYMAIDAAIGEILMHIDKETILFVLASHRMAHNYGAQLLLPKILVRLKFSEKNIGEDLADGSVFPIDELKAVYSWSKAKIPDGIKKHLKPVYSRIRGLAEGNETYSPCSCWGIDIKKSKCFPLDNGLSVGGVRVNLMGREPNGIVRPGAEMDSLCEELAQELMEIVDADTGIPMVKSVTRTGDLYQGEYLDHLPDILVEWSDEKYVGSTGTGNPMGSEVRLFSKKIGLLKGVNTYCRTGDHRPEGLFIAYGGGIEAGRMDRTVSLMDFAPTFSELLDVELPEVDGAPIKEIIRAFKTRT